MNMKIDRTLRNTYYFFHLANFNKEFMAGLLRLKADWPSPFINNPVGDWFDIGQEHKKKILNRVHKQRDSYFELLKRDGNDAKFKSNVIEFLDEQDLGREWLNTIVDILVSSWFHPPSLPLDVGISEKNGKRRVVITLEPDAKRDDLAKAWPYINGMLKIAHPDYRYRNISLKSFKDLNLVIRDAWARLRDIDSYKTDLDRVGEYWKGDEAMDISLKADRKRAQLLRTKRLRVKRKLK